jgi:DNA-binding XRE family transcriptional regulator
MTKNQEWEAYLYEQGEVNEEEPMNEVKKLRLAAGLTQHELSLATGISPIDTNEAETGERPLDWLQWTLMQYTCGNRIREFKRDAGLTIKLG